MTSSLTATVAGQVRAEMARAQVSGVRLAEHLGKSHAYVSRRINGHVPFDTDDLQAIATLLGVSLDALIPLERAAA